MALGLFAGQTREQGQAGANAAARIQHGHRCRGMFAGNSVFELSYCTGMQEASVEDEERYAIAQDMDGTAWEAAYKAANRGTTMHARK